MKYLRYVPFLLLLLVPMATLAAADTSFVPLTNVPFLEKAGDAQNLPEFLNQLYRICIGLAAVLAVLQIMRAGVMYMGSDSGFAEKKEAKNLIGLAIGGLILVLSPVVVFSIINPDILSLKIEGIEDLRPKNDVGATSGDGLSTEISDGDTTTACKAKGGKAALFCGSTANGTQDVLAGNTCPTGSSLKTSCGVSTTVPTQCSLYDPSSAEFSLAEGMQSCSADKESVNAECCQQNVRPGYVCCMKKK